MDCTTFRSRTTAFLGEALDPAERERCREHLDACPDCARRIEIEASFDRALRRRLAVGPAPPGLATRVRAALRSAATVRDPRAARWWNGPWLSASAAAVLLVAVLVAGPSPAPVAVPGQVTLRGLVVDHDCDLHGIDPIAQRDCPDPTHVNVLRLPDGRHVRFAGDEAATAGAPLAALGARAARGVEVAVAGRYVPAIRTLEVESVRGL